MSDPASSPAPDQPTPTGRRLVVMVPGFLGKLTNWQPLVDRLKQEPEFASVQTTWLPYQHGIKLRSTKPLESVARDLAARISEQWLLAGGFDDVLLIGHSMGGLVVRQCYLLAAGGLPGTAPQAWSGSVRRIVLMASINRGLNTETKWSYRLLSYAARVLPIVPRLTACQVLRGSGFLTNLRINWIRHFSRVDTDPSVAAPTVVQLLGTQDSEVSPEDSQDLLAFPDGHYLSVSGANHRSLQRLDTAENPDARYAVIRQALLGHFPSKPRAVDAVTRVVFILHGIRDSNVADWVKSLADRIGRREGDKVRVVNPTYGYFTAARFAFPSVRRRYVRVFQDWYTEALAHHPNAQFDVIAHSNGTYLLGHSLLTTPGMRFTNVVLAGSVLPQDFWTRFDGQLPSQVKRIRNDRANRDWPVALLCNALVGLRMRDVGTGGFSGFLGSTTHEIAYYTGGHSAALERERLDSLVDFALDGPCAPPADLSPNTGVFQSLSNSMPYLAKLLVLALLAGTAYFVMQGGEFHGDRAVSVVLGLLIAYILLDIF